MQILVVVVSLRIWREKKKILNILPLEISPFILNSVLINLLTVKWTTSELSF